MSSKKRRFPFISRRNFISCRKQNNTLDDNSNYRPVLTINRFSKGEMQTGGWYIDDNLTNKTLVWITTGDKKLDKTLIDLNLKLIELHEMGNDVSNLELYIDEVKV